MSVQITTYQNLADKQRRGYQAISFDSLVATTPVTIKAGSVLEVAGALYEFQADETESGGTWAAIGNSNVVYLYIVPAGSTATFIYSTTVPTWDQSKQSWYNGTSRAVASLYKDAGGLYQQKFILPSWLQPFALPGGVARKVVITSGALGALSVTGDTDYILTAASTGTLPVAPPVGCQLTFKNKGNFTSTISAAAGQTIGTTTSTSFVLYAQEDYVTLEWDGVSIWYVKATNGPLLTSLQTGALTASNSMAWTAIGLGYALASLAPGVYDLELSCGMYSASGQYFAVALGNGTTVISETGYCQGGSAGPCKITLKNYVLNAAATIQGLYYWSSGAAGIGYSATNNVGRITARRIG